MGANEGVGLQDRVAEEDVGKEEIDKRDKRGGQKAGTERPNKTFQIMEIFWIFLDLYGLDSHDLWRCGALKSFI